MDHQNVPTEGRKTGGAKGSMSTTWNSIFTCTKCLVPRQYGASQFYREPVNVFPVLNCEGNCNAPTVHAFVKIELRGEMDVKRTKD